ncbi:MAG: hypothetical protein M3Z09_05670 [Acidobacteriota bacterium]|nr:hypothetical protein [Acidobacteriota bacterium]
MQVHVSHGTRPSLKKQNVALYRAAIRLRVEYAALEFNASFTQDQIQLQLVKHPSELKIGRWPPALSHKKGANLQIMALTRIKAMLEVGTTLPETNPTEMRKATYRQFLRIDPEAVPTGESEIYSRIFVDAGVDEDGHAFVESTVEAHGVRPPGLRCEIAAESSQGHTDTELFWRNLLRADILERIMLLQE